VTGILFGLVPALQCTKVDLVTALKETRATQPHTRHSFLPISTTQFLLIPQLAISLLLLITAGLFVRTLSNLGSVNLGFNRENLLLFEINAH
jgi:macrolide transport system ATP-binding/permease protein